MAPDEEPFYTHRVDALEYVIAMSKVGYTHKDHKAVTSKEIAQLIDIWDGNTVRQIAETMKISVKRVRYMANAIRDVDESVLVPKHAPKGSLDHAIEQGIRMAR